MKDTNENRLAHLQMLQGVINRLAGNSSLTKGWSVTVAAALFTVGVFSERGEVAFVALFPALIFWALDAYYLRQERLFRNLYRVVRSAEPDTLAEPFTMDTSPHKTSTDCYLYVFIRPPLSLFHGSIVVAVVAVAILINL